VLPPTLQSTIGLTVLTQVCPFVHEKVQTPPKHGQLSVPPHPSGVVPQSEAVQVVGVHCVVVVVEVVSVVVVDAGVHSPDGSQVPVEGVPPSPSQVVASSKGPAIHSDPKGVDAPEQQLPAVAGGLTHFPVPSQTVPGVPAAPPGTAMQAAADGAYSQAPAPAGKAQQTSVVVVEVVVVVVVVVVVSPHSGGVGFVAVLHTVKSAILSSRHAARQEVPPLPSGHACRQLTASSLMTRRQATLQMPRTASCAWPVVVRIMSSATDPHSPRE
jgi:hypothetical protein